MDIYFVRYTERKVIREFRTGLSSPTQQNIGGLVGGKRY